MFSKTKCSPLKRDRQLPMDKGIIARDLEICRIKQQEKVRTICRVKIYMLICLLSLCKIWEKFLVEERLKSIQISAASSDGRKKKDSSERRIHLILKEEARNIGIIHRKRFLSPEIQLCHSIAVLKDSSKEAETSKNSLKFTSKSPIYMHARDFTQDKVRDKLPYEDGLLNYKQDYFSTLLEMFPSLDGYASIWTDRNDSFYAFINKEGIKDHKYNILACLFLLANGVNVPLKFKKNGNRISLVLKKADNREDYFRASINTFVKANKEGTWFPYLQKMVYQRKAAGVVNFFIENRKKRIIKERERTLGTGVCDNLLEKRRFVDGPGFLIQTYICHFIESTEEMVLFEKKVYSLLCEYIGYEEEIIEGSKTKQLWRNLKGSCKEQEDANLEDVMYMEELAIFNSCFVISKKKSTDSQDKDIIYPARMLYNDFIKHQENLLYFEPTEDAVISEENVKNEVKFTDYTEISLLGMFCWAVYNNEKNIYTVDHIKNASEELKNFFKKHKNMYGSVTQGVLNDWRKVLCNLSNPSICYAQQNKAHLMPGLVNILYVIKEITGIGKTKEIDKIKERLNQINNNDMTEEITLYKEISASPESSKENKVLMEKKIINIISRIEMKKKTDLEKRLKSAENVEAAIIKLELQNLKNIMEERNKMNRQTYIKSYFVQEKILKLILGNDIRTYLTKVIKKIALYQDINIEFCEVKTHKNGFCDIFERLKIHYDRNNLIEKDKNLVHPYFYEFNVFPPYSCDNKEVKLVSSFKIFRKEFSQEEESSPIIKELNLCLNKEVEISRPRERNNEIANPNIRREFLFDYTELCKDIHTLLLNPLVCTPKHKMEILWEIFLYVKDKNIRKTHPLVYLADNIMKSVSFINDNDKDSIFMVHSLNLTEDYHPNITVDKNAYQKPSYFINTLVKVIELANTTVLPSYKTHADIIIKLIINFQENLLKNNDYFESELFNKELSSINIPMLIKILTLNGSTQDHITRLIKVINEKKEYPDHTHKNHNSYFLRWITLVVTQSTTESFLLH
ncbi:hypothetical protein NEAUS03_0567 [Nematocida ausubeli]|nr:hypothetical protein NEAUS03_0567 [Nematocida ausubeli]